MKVCMDERRFQSTDRYFGITTGRVREREEDRSLYLLDIVQTTHFAMRAADRMSLDLDV